MLHWPGSRTETLHLAVGHDGLTASTPAASHLERKVSLPYCWVRGFAEVPTMSASMSHRGSLVGPAVSKLLGALPRVAPPGPFLHLVPAPGSWRIATHRSERSIPLPGATRLRGSERVTRHARRLDVYASPTGTTAWVFELPGSRLTLVLSPEPYGGHDLQVGAATVGLGATASDQAHALEGAQVVREQVRRHSEQLSQVRGCRVPEAERVDDAEPGRV